MGKSSKKSSLKVNAAPPVSATPAKEMKKGKREAEELIEKEVGVKKLKKGGVVAESIVKKTEIKKTKVEETSSSEYASSSDSEQELKAPANKAVQPPKKSQMSATKNGTPKKVKQPSSSDDSDTSDDNEPDEPPKRTKASAAAKTFSLLKKPEQKKVESSEPETDEESSDSDKDASVTTKLSAAAKNGPVTATKKEDDSESGDESSSSEDEKSSSKAAKNGTPAAATKSNESESEEESSSSDDDADVPAAAKIGQVAKKENETSDDSDLETSDSEDAAQPKTIPTKRPSTATESKKVEEESSEDDSSDEEPQKKKSKVPSGPVASMKPKSGEEDSSDEESSEESSDDETLKAPSVKKPTGSAATVKPKSGNKDSSSEEDSSEESSDDETSKAPAVKKAVISKKSSSDESSSGDEEESSDDEGEEPKKTPQKKGTDVEMVDALPNKVGFSSVKKEPKTPAAQSQSGSKTLFVGNLSFSVERADVEAFFKDCGEVVDVRFATHPDGAFKGFGHVEFATAEAAQEIREVSFDAEDVLDDLSFLFARNHGDGFCGRVQKIYSSIKNLRTRHRISSEIKNIKARVENISARHQRYQSIYGIQERTIARNTDYDIRATSLLIEEARLVGIDNPKRALISQILDDNPRLKVISVVGMGGLGKTTLVRKVYDNAAVKKQFQSHSWLTVSQTFQVLVSVKDLIQQLFVEIGKPVPLEVNECTDIVRLSAFVKAFLQDRRYIVVLDDVWSTNSWDAIKYLLPDCNSGSRVILTTRRVDVASASCLESHYHVHRMEPLSDKDSWTLFCNRAFQSSHCPLYLEDVSKRIIKKCEGLPLGIVAICGVLALKDKDKIGDWKMILHSLGGELEEGSGKLDQIRKILLLSYNDLTHHLKSCLLSFCVFSEDNEIYLDQLIWKWIAHGFVQENNGISAVDIGRRYAKELISRSLLQVTRTTTCGTSEFVRVHDFLREIIAQKSREQNFGALATGYFPRGSEKVRLLAIYDFVDNDGSQELNDCLKSVRSLEFFGERSRLSAPVLSKFLRGCSKKLKVLDLRAAALEDIPGEVFKLFHLKYLCLRDTEVRTIPKSIGKLQNLDFLDFSGTKVAELPVEILMLRKLRSLEGGSVVGNYSGNFIVRGIKFPRGIGKLLSLESLRTIEADDKEIVREIRKLKKLRNLEISKLKRDDGKELLSSLEKLTNLENLGVVSINEEEPIDLEYSVSPTPSSLETIALVGHLGSVPKWVISLDSLTSLWLMNSGLKEDDVTGIEAIQVLPNLAYLDLNHAYGGETLSVKAGGFQKLKELRLVKLERLRWVRLEKDSMPSLEKLIIAGCKLMEGLPFGIENLTNLNCLQLLDMSDGLAEKMKNLDKRSDEYQKIAHIPEVVIGYWKNGEWERSLL